MLAGSSWSEEFVRQIAEPEMRHAYMADQVRTRIALQIRALREQVERGWSQVELGRRAGKPQNVISRIENPDYGQLTLQTLFDMAAAFDVPLYVDFPEWEDWLGRMRDLSPDTLQRQSFDLNRVMNSVRAATTQIFAAATAAAMATEQASVQRSAATAAQAQASAQQPHVAAAQLQVFMQQQAVVIPFRPVVQTPVEIDRDLPAQDRSERIASFDPNLYAA